MADGDGDLNGNTFQLDIIDEKKAEHFPSDADVSTEWNDNSANINEWIMFLSKWQVKVWGQFVFTLHHY